MAAKSNPESANATPKRGPSKDVLTKAAKLRAEGATWNAIREATGTKLGSSSWFRAWEREGIDHIPAGERLKPKADKPVAEQPGAPAAEGAAKRKRTVRRSAAKK